MTTHVVALKVGDLLRSVLSSLAVLLLLLLPWPVVGQDVQDVASAQDLQDALMAEQDHVRITQHIYPADNEDQLQPLDGIRFTDFLYTVQSGTRSITGACEEPPPSTVKLQGDWKTGMCLVQVQGTSGFLISERQGELWLHNLYVHLTGAQTRDVRRSALALTNAQNEASVYITSVTLDARPEERSGLKQLVVLYVDDVGSDSKPGRIRIMASDVNILRTPATTDLRLTDPGDVEGVPALAYFGTNTGPISMLNTALSSNAEPGSPLVQFSCDLRLENCTFLSYPKAVADLVYRSAQYAHRIYSGVPRDSNYELWAFSDSVRPIELPLAASDADVRASAGLLPFPTLEDEPFVTLQREVLGEAITTAPRPPPPLQPPPTEDPADAPPPTTPSTPALNSLAVAAIAAAAVLCIGAVVAVLFVCCLLCMRRASHWRSSEGKDLPARATTPERAALHRGRRRRDQQVVEVRQAVSESIELGSRQISGPWALDSLAESTPFDAARHQGPQLSDAPNFDSASLMLPPPTTMRGSSTETLSIKDELLLLEDALDHVHARGLRLAGRWTLLGSGERRVSKRSIVQLARDEELRKDHAIKFLLDPVAFEVEARLYAQPDAKDLTPATVYLEPAGRQCPVTDVLPAWIVLERGWTLQDIAQGSHCIPCSANQMMEQILHQLVILHAKGAVHCNVKASNILWRRDARAWTLIDYGCTVDAGQPSTAAQSNESTSIAPEVVMHAVAKSRSPLRVKTSLDIWCLGAVMYEYLTGTTVLRPGAPPFEVIHQMRGWAFLPWEREFATNHQEQLGKLGTLKSPILACLARKPAERPTAMQLLEAIRATAAAS